MNKLDVADALAFNKAAEVLLNDKAAHLSGGGDRKTGLAVVGLHFDNQRAEDVNAEGLTRLFILRIFTHWGGNVVVDPVVGPLVVIIATACALLCRSAAGKPGTDLFNLR
ncbi:hypothetical protein D3C76_1248530 [compost metagenome]